MDETDAKPSERAKLENKVQRYKDRIAETRKERGRLKWFVVVGTALAPVGFIWGPLYALWIFLGGLTFWGVGLYLNWGHVRDAQGHLRDAESDLERYLQAHKDEA